MENSKSHECLMSIFRLTRMVNVIFTVLSMVDFKLRVTRMVDVKFSVCWFHVQSHQDGWRHDKSHHEYWLQSQMDNNISRQEPTGVCFTWLEAQAPPPSHYCCQTVITDPLSSITWVNILPLWESLSIISHQTIIKAQWESLKITFKLNIYQLSILFKEEKI